MTESTLVLKHLVELSTSLKGKRFADVAHSLVELDDHDIQEIDEAIVLVRSFLNNLKRYGDH